MFLGGITRDSHTASIEEHWVEAAVAGVFDDQRYNQAQLETVTVSRTETILLSEVDHVEITVSVPAGHPLPAVAEPLHDAIVEQLEYDVGVEVQFVQVQTAS